MLYCKERGESFCGSLSFFVVIRRNLRHITKSKPLGAVLLVLSPSGLFCDAPHLTPSGNKTVRIVQSFCSLLTTKLLALLASALCLKCSFTQKLLGGPFYPLLPFDTLARKSPLFFRCYTKSIPFVVRTLEALCKKMRKKELRYVKIIDKIVCFSAKNCIFAC